MRNVSDKWIRPTHCVLQEMKNARSNMCVLGLSGAGRGIVMGKRGVDSRWTDGPLRNVSSVERLKCDYEVNEPGTGDWGGTDASTGLGGLGR